MSSWRAGRRGFARRVTPVPDGFAGVRQWFLSFLALGALALTRPLLDIYGENPQVFVSSQAGRGQIVTFALLATFAVPVIVTLVVVLLGRVRRGADRWVALPIGLLLGAVVGLVAARSLLPDHTWAAFVFAAFGAAATVPLLQWGGGRQVLAYVSLLAPLSLALFLFGSPTSPLLWQDEAAASEGAIARPAPIVYLQLDELPLALLLNSDQEINADLFPNFARLGERSNWYRNAVSPSHATEVAVPSILTGNLGANDTEPTSRSYPDNLFTLVGGSYRLRVTEDVTDLCPAELCPGPDAGFGDLLSDASIVYSHLSVPKAWQENLVAIDGTWSGFGGTGEEAVAAAGITDLPVPRLDDRLSWVDDWQAMIDDFDNAAIEAGDRPTLWYTHVRTPHPPWAVNPSGTHYHDPEDVSDLPLGVEADRWTDTPGSSLAGLQRQLLQLGFVDTMLGRTIDRLDETGLWDEAVVVVLADHGNSFRPGDYRRTPTAANVDSVYRVPLFVSLPGQDGGRVHDEPVNTIDVLPTLVETLGADVDWEFDGRSLLDPDPDPETQTATEPRPHQFVPFNDAGPADTRIEALGPLIDELDRRIPDRSSWAGVVNGPARDAPVTTRLDALDARAGVLRWQIVQGNSLAHVSRRRGIVPTVLTGQLEVPESVTSTTLRVAINGTIAGTGSYIRTGATAATFYAVLTEDLVPDGEARVSLLVRDDDGQWLTGRDDDLAPVYRDQDGTVIEPGPETRGLRIYVQRAQRDGDDLIVEATAFQKITDQPARRFLVYAGDQLLGATAPNADTPDIAAMNGTEVLARTGMRLAIPADDVPDGTRLLTVVAVIGDEAVAEGVTISG